MAADDSTAPGWDKEKEQTGHPNIGQYLQDELMNKLLRCK